MSSGIINEYTTLLQKKAYIETALSTLPNGYISKKIIGGKEYKYLQVRINGKITSTYLKNDEVETIANKILLRKSYEKELPKITKRLNELEQASILLNSDITRRLAILNLSIGMDELSKDIKQECITFSEAMTSIEGFSASEETKNNLNSWKDGSITFLSIFESTLKKYGFSVEG